MRIPLVIITALFVLCCSCSAKKGSDQSDTLVSMQIIDRNGFTETISNKDRLSDYRSTDFSTPQPYQKVLRVFGRNPQGQASSRSYSQYLSLTHGLRSGYVV